MFKQGDFQIPPGTTPEVLQRKREMISAMVNGKRVPQYAGEGWAQLASGALGGLLGKRLLDEQRALNEQTKAMELQTGADASAAFDAFFGGGGGDYGGSGGYGGGYSGGTGTDPMMPSSLEPQITGPMSPFDALVMGGGPTNTAAGMLDTFGAPNPAAVNNALTVGGGPTNAAAAALNAPPMATAFPRWYY